EPGAHEAMDIVRSPGRAFPAYPQLRLSWPRQSAVVARLREFQPTLVHAATEFGMGLAGRRAARLLDVPFVSSYHTSFTAYAAHYGMGLLARPGWAYLRWFHNGGHRTYCPTAAIVQEVEAQGFERCTVWTRGVDGHRFAPRYRSAAFRTAIGAHDGTLVAAYVGRLAAEKQVDVALEAVRLAATARPGAVRLLVVGDGPCDVSARSRAPEGSTFTGRLEGAALSEAYASADVLLFPSTTDTFGNVMLEAMASGTPVIGADVAPTREVLLPDRGWVAPPGDATTVASLLTRLIDDRTPLHQRREAGLAHAAACTWEAVWDRLFADYLTVQASSPAARGTTRS
ncbi:MAG: glycosyltransferase family 4 protein, partial [Gemmatimonas sp.]